MAFIINQAIYTDFSRFFYYQVSLNSDFFETTCLKYKTETFFLVVQNMLGHPVPTKKSSFSICTFAFARRDVSHSISFSAKGYL